MILRHRSPLQDIYQFGPFPTAILAELRQKFSTKLDQSVVTTNSPSSKAKVNDQEKFAYCDDDCLECETTEAQITR